MQQGYMMLLLMVVLVVFMIIPQFRRQKQEKKFAQALKVGDKVITKSGMHGKIVQMADASCVIETLSGKIKFERSAISMEMSSKLNAPATEDKKKK
ncbi:preprotein translocase subunit YajC [Neptunitalea chrysea]|uniref:Sec translocon accessory complex subunit YajC n=1 Tax=Neptunitalea chrysea TaxID=1647581 RepID=A0A9W6EW28_9FLAO|nr:preprotein translocase subunit YajC [Neptunitalea chrysea]GLB53706.1 preprotein translocase subunit YajC [Neptunitalea chrysea]